MENLTPENIHDVARLIYHGQREKVHHLWLNATDPEQCILLIEQALSNDNIFPVIKRGQVVGVALTETQDSPSALRVSRSFWKENFGFWGGLLRWIRFIVYKKIQVRLTPETLHLELLVVAAEYRRQGIGTQIIDDVARLAAKLGKTQLIVAVAESDQRSLDFFTANGFAPSTGNDFVHSLFAK